MRIALFEPDIPQNTGNIFRLGACLGVPVDIIEPAGFILDDNRFKRASMDYIKYLNFKKHKNCDIFYTWSRENLFRIILLTTKTNKSYTKFNFSNSDILLFGRESAGVPEYVHNSVNHKLTIPMQKGPRSINLSSSVAIVTGEAIRQINMNL